MEPGESGTSSVAGAAPRSSAGAPSREALEALFCAHLPRIEGMAGSVARRSGFPPDECPDVVAWVRLRLVEGDYAILAKHRGESSLECYLAVVVTRLVRDYRMKTWGRWRPSALAVRHGSIAVRLETLTRRDRVPYEQAILLIRSAGHAVSDRELLRLHKLLPHREPLRPREIEIGDPDIEDALAVPPEADGAAASGEDRARGIFAAVDRAIRGLPPEEQSIVRLRYGEGLSIADVARALGLAEKPLYRRLPLIVRRVREELEAAGYSRVDAAEVFADA